MVLTALSLGCGLLVERITGIDIPGVLLPAVGFALIIVVAQFFTLDGGLAELTTPVTVALAGVGFWVSPPPPGRGNARGGGAAAGGALAGSAGPPLASRPGPPPGP